MVAASSARGLNFQVRFREPIRPTSKTRHVEQATQRRGTMRTMSATSSLLMLFFVLFSFCSSSVSASIPQSFRHTNLHRTIDLTKPYIRESTTIVIENISNKTQTEYFWGIPLSLVPKLSYLEVKEKSSCDSANLPIEKVQRHHPYHPQMVRQKSLMVGRYNCLRFNYLGSSLERRFRWWCRAHTSIA